MWVTEHLAMATPVSPPAAVSSQASSPRHSRDISHNPVLASISADEETAPGVECSTSEA